MGHKALPFFVAHSGAVQYELLGTLSIFCTKTPTPTSTLEMCVIAHAHLYK